MGFFSSNKNDAPTAPTAPDAPATSPDVATKEAITRALEAQGLKYQDISDDRQVLRLGFGLANYKDFSIFLFVDEDGESYQLRSGVILSVTSEQRTAILEAANKVNGDFRWARFYLDSDDDLVMQQDIDYSPSDGAATAAHAIMRAAAIMDSAYPEFMKARWA